jgi:hypothetical protein
VASVVSQARTAPLFRSADFRPLQGPTGKDKRTPKRRKRRAPARIYLDIQELFGLPNVLITRHGDARH